MNKNKKLLLGIALVVVVAAIAFGLSNRATTPNTITVGVLSPEAGDYAVAGENMEKGMQLALSLYEAKHPNQKVNLVIENDGFDPKVGISAYKKLTSIDHVDAVMMLSTPVVDAIHEDVIKSGIPLLTIGIQTVGIGPDNIFQMSPAPDMPIGYFAQYANDHFSFKKVAVVYDNTPGGLSFYNAFKAGYKGNFDGMVVNSQNDLRDYATKIVRGGYDAVAFLTSPQNGAIGVKDILALTKNHPQFLFDAQLQTGFADYGRILGNTSVLDGSYSLWLKSGDQGYFSTEFKKKYGTDPGFVADFGYDTFNTLMDAYNADDKTWVKNIQNTNTSGASGGVKFDQNGVRLQDIVINVVKDGKIVPLQ